MEIRRRKNASKQECASVSPDQGGASPPRVTDSVVAGVGGIVFRERKSRRGRKERRIL